MFAFRTVLLLLASRHLLVSAVSEIVPGAYIVELESGQDASTLAGSVKGFGKVSKSYDFKLFKGASIQIEQDEEPNQAMRLLAKTDAVKRVWPVSRHSLPETTVHWVGNDTKEYRLRKSIKANNQTVLPFAPHAMTQVDRLHEKGYTGKGANIAIIDTGVDYLHPALGGCFGEGCLIVRGHDYVGDDYTGRNEPVPDDDPMDCEGHGTHLAGIMASQTNPLGFTGAAPGATLSVYRVFGCFGSATDDVLLEAFNQAYEDGANIISLSLGAPGGWSEHPWSVVMSRIVDAGVPCIVAAGNDGEQGMFFASNPADGHNVASIASLESTRTPKFYKQSTYDITGGGSVVPFLYDLGFRAPAEGSKQLWSPATDSGSSEEGCEPYASDELDLSNRLVLLKAGGCADELKTQNAVDANATAIIIYNNQTGFAPVPISVPWEIQTLATVEARQGEEWIAALHENQTVVVTFPAESNQTSSLVEVENAVSGGSVDFFSTWGPTWELDVKPQFASPGGSILSTFPLRKGGYAVQSGTSMATPLVAAIYALLGEVRGTFEPKVLENLLASTAKPQLFHDKTKFLSFLAPVPQQGAGAVQAYDAAFTDAILEPSSLSFNDSDYHATNLSFSLSNQGDDAVTYEFSNVPSQTVFTLDQDAVLPGRFPNEMADSGAELKFSKSSVTLAAGESITVDVSATPPQVDEKRLALWSGWIAINATTGAALSLPYQGLLGSLHDAHVLRDGGAWISRFDIPNRDPMPENSTFNLPPQNVPGWENDGLNVPLLICDYVLGTQSAKAELIPTSSEDDEALGEHPNFATQWLSRGRKTIDWNGQLKTGEYAPPGTYRFRISALRLRGDPDIEADWEKTWTQSFTLTYQTA